MTRNEFMDIANKEIEQILVAHKNRMMGLVERAWAEGKKNAEVSGIEDIIKEAMDKIYQQTGTLELLPPDIHFEHLLEWSGTSPLAIDSIPNACRTCSNHPSNGGSGICHCVMGIPTVSC